MSAVIDDHGHAGHDHHHGPAKGLSRWLLTTNHKDIGSMYLWFSFCAFLLGGSMAMVIRAELFQPGLQINRKNKEKEKKKEQKRTKKNKEAEKKEIKK